MRKIIILGALAAVLALPVVAMPDSADAASCRSRKTTGTVLGGVGGALLGSAVGGTGATIVGAAGGGLVGHEVGRSGCKRRVAYRSTPARYSSSAAAPAPQRVVYYDQYGNRVATSR